MAAGVNSILSSLSAGLNPTYSQTFGVTWQNYRTDWVKNNRIAMYTLRVSDFNYQKKVEFIFPISPSNLKVSRMNMTTLFDVAGQPQNAGVLRYVDQYGMSPPIFTIEGTTGWNKHSNDGFKYTGLESMQQLQQIFDFFAQKNQYKIQSQQTDLYKMEFYDYYSLSFWEVVPIGEVSVRQNENKPTIQYYTIQLAGIADVSSQVLIPTEPNPIDQLFQSAAGNIVNTTKTFINRLSGAYSEITGVF